MAAGIDDISTSISLSQTEISDALPIANSVAVADNEDNIENILNNIQLEEEPVDLKYEDIPKCVESLLFYHIMSSSLMIDYYLASVMTI